MSLLILAAMAVAQAPSAEPPATQAVNKKKPAQVCEYLEITGSRAKHRVCHDEGAAANLGAYGVSDSAFGKGTFQNADPKAPAAPK